jgi:predicted acylesterase/phospholipase RssA
MTTAFVLSGGGSLGAVQVGMMQTLEDRGVVRDFLVGASAGVLNAAFVAGRGFSAASPGAHALSRHRPDARTREDDEHASEVKGPAQGQQVPTL